MKRKRDPDKISDRSAKKRKDDNSYKRILNSDDPYDQTGPSIKEMPISDHPHREEILD